MLSRFLIDFALKMASNLPCIIPKSIDCSGILVYDYSKLFNKEEIGKGSFGSVYSAEIPSADGTKQSEKVVIKKLLSQDMEDKKQFIRGQNPAESKAWEHRELQGGSAMLHLHW